MEKRTLRNIEAKIDQGDYYDALQLSRALFDRFAKRQDIKGCLEFAERYATILAEKGQYELTVKLGQRALQLLQSLETEPTEDLLIQLMTYFLLCPAGSTKAKYDFMNRLIEWSKKCSASENDLQQASEGSVMLHSVMADAYMEEEDYGRVQGHVVFCDDVDMMYNMLKAWQKQGYPSEEHFFTLRLIMILLYRGRITSAEKLLDKLPIDFNTGEVPAPLQYANLLTAACKYESSELCELLSRKYALILRTDPGLQKLQGAISAKYFDVQSESSGIMGMLKSFLMAQPASS